MRKILPFVGQPSETTRHLNEIVQQLNRTANISGGNYIRVRHAEGGITIDLDIYKLIPALIKDSGSNGIMRVVCSEDAPAGTIIKAWRLDADGVAIDGSGETEIDVNCDIFGGSSLATAVPRLVDGDEIPVYQFNGDYYCAFWFHDSCTQDCEGS